MSRKIAHAAEQRISRLLAMPDVAIKAIRAAWQPPQATNGWPVSKLQEIAEKHGMNRNWLTGLVVLLGVVMQMEAKPPAKKPA